jgi:hypothetical protein
MAPRANWKGVLRLSLVTCPVALYPATSDSEKISFNQINRNTGHRIKYARVDADTGEEVAAEDIMKGFKVDTDTYVEVTKEELENVALESTRTIEIDEILLHENVSSNHRDGSLTVRYLHGKIGVACGARGFPKNNWHPIDGVLARLLTPKLTTPAILCEISPSGRASPALILTVLCLNQAMNRRASNALEYRAIRRGRRLHLA